MKKILVLGSGYLGSEIVYKLAKNNDVFCMDHGKQFSTIQKLCTNVKLISGDITDKNLLRKNSEDVDEIFYCIGTGGVMDCIQDVNRYEKINVKDFKIILNTLNFSKQTRFFLFSSSYVYPDKNNITEKTDKMPETLYGQLRSKQEELLKSKICNYVILRLSNVFGYGHFMNIGNMGVVEKFIHNAFTNKEIVIHGNGEQQVDLLNKFDLMDLVEILVNSNIRNKVYNVSSGITMSVNELAEIISKIMKEKIEYEIKIFKKKDLGKIPNIPKISSNKIKEELKWRVSTSIESHIEKMIMAYYSQHKRYV